MRSLVRSMVVLGAVVASAVLSTPPASSQEDASINIPAGDHVLAGVLTLPVGAGPFPAAVLISGSGPSDRDESLPGVALKPLARLAHELAEAGIATLRYDDRGVGQSTGDFLSATSFDFADDANAAFTVLASHEAIDATRVGLIGHSEGGMVAPRVAIQNPNVAFVVSIAGTAVSGYDLFSDQLRRSLLALPEADRDAAFDAQIHSLDLAVAEDWEGVEAMLGADEGATPDHVAQGMIYYRGWLHTFVTHDPAEDWLRVDRPVLAVLGGLDLQVSVELNKPALEAALVGNSDATIIVLPTANHLFQAATSGAMSEYGTLPDAFVEGFSSIISEWILSRTSR